MAKVAPYHTSTQEDPPVNRNVYHDHDDCYEGKKIKPENKQSGTASRPLCEVCERLG